MQYEIELSTDQRFALTQLVGWRERNISSYITLGGYAGTGKTTLIAVFRRILYKQNSKLKIAFCSYTGKGTLVLKNKLKELDAIYKGDSVSTIHGLVYEPIENKNQQIVGWQKKPEVKTDLIIVDEASMIDENIWQDLRSYNIPIIAIGDHGQLPPINGILSLMQEPNIKLTTIHRQAENNPIIKLATLARTDGKIDPGKYGKFVRKYSRNDLDFSEAIESLLLTYNEDTMILCGYNHTRVSLNTQIRYHLGFEDTEPCVGDKVICLRNNHAKGIFNGMLGKIKYIEDGGSDSYFCEIELDGNKRYKGEIFKEQFNAKDAINFTKDRKKLKDRDIFDFGYALTVHKAQGSEAEKVILFEERFKQMDDENWKKWLYTAVTRAKTELYIFGD